jgi:hypothetical protein
MEGAKRVSMTFSGPLGTKPQIVILILRANTLAQLIDHSDIDMLE